MKSINKVLSLVLAVLMISSVLSVISASALTTVIYGDYECEKIDENSVKIYKYCGTDTDITLPKYFGNIRVVGISDSAFENTALNSVVIPEGYTSIGNFAFYGATDITDIKIPSTVSSIGISAFAFMENLSNFDLSDAHSLTVLPDYMLRNCTALKCISIPSTVTEISSGVFRESGLESVSIPDSVTGIGNNLFYKCISLIDVQLPSEISAIPEYAFYGCSGLTSLDIPESVNSIGNRAFYGCTGLNSLVLPDGIASIGARVFANCTGLTSLTLPLNLTSIGNNAFENCSALTSLELSPFLKTLGSNVFDGCSGISKLLVPRSVTSIGNNCFYPAIQQTMTVQVYSGSFVEDYCYTSFSRYEVLSDVLGDFNLDGVVDIRDVTNVQKYIVGATTATYKAIGLAEVTNDDMIDIRDVTKIQMYISNDIDTLA